MPDTQKADLDHAVQTANASFSLWSSKSWNERRKLLRDAMEELKAHTDELCTILITLLDNPPAEAAYVLQENFGPLRAVIKYQDLDEAVRLANGTPYGLGASVWGKELLDAVARRLDAGMVWINQHLNLHPNVPFSGRKSSGIGIEFSEDGLKEFCNLQVIANKR